MSEFYATWFLSIGPEYKVSCWPCTPGLLYNFPYKPVYLVKLLSFSPLTYVWLGWKTKEEKWKEYDNFPSFGWIENGWLWYVL